MNEVKCFSEPCSPGSPRSLGHLCRLEIRRRLTLRKLNNTEIMSSQLFPPRLKSFILYQELDLYSQDPERIMWGRVDLLLALKGWDCFLIFVICGCDERNTVWMTLVSINCIFIITWVKIRHLFPHFTFSTNVLKGTVHLKNTKNSVIIFWRWCEVGCFNSPWLFLDRAPSH